MERFRSFTWPKGVEEPVLRQKKIISTIPVHEEFRRITHRRESDSIINSIYNETGCIVVAHWDQNMIKRFDVFAGAASKNAIAAVNKWIARGDEKSKDSAAWAKTPAFNHAQWYQEQLEHMEDERTEFFLGAIPDEQNGDSVRLKLVLDWPNDLLDHEVTPRTAFGNGLQALHDIRKRDQVFITLLSNHRVEILGFDTMNVNAAENHYKTMLERVRTETCSLQQATNVIMDDGEGTDVVLLRAESWWPNLTDMVVPRLLPNAMMHPSGSFREENMRDIQLREIQNSLRRALKAVTYKRGSYDFAVRLGCIALSSKQFGEDHIGKKHGKEKFIKSINGKIDLSSKKWLLDNMLGTQLYHRLVATDGILEPIKAASYWGTVPSNLRDTRPSLRGTWVFRDPNSMEKQRLPPSRNAGGPDPLQQMPPTAASSTQSSFFVVQIDWTDDGEGSYDKTETRFYRLDQGKSGPRVNMEVNLLELGESRAWFFALESMTPIPRSTIPPVLAGFAQRTVLKQGYDVNSTETFAVCDPSPSANALLLNGRSDKVYLFGVRNTYYKVELTAMWYLGHSSPCWGLAVRHTEWATHLAELERLQTGHQASWGNILRTFLPDDGCSSSSPEGDGLGASDQKHNDEVKKSPHDPPNEGIRTLTNIMLQLSEIVSLVTVGGGVQI